MVCHFPHCHFPTRSSAVWRWQPKACDLTCLSTSNKPHTRNDGIPPWARLVLLFCAPAPCWWPAHRACSLGWQGSPSREARRLAHEASLVRFRVPEEVSISDFGVGSVLRAIYRMGCLATDFIFLWVWVIEHKYHCKFSFFFFPSRHG